MAKREIPVSNRAINWKVNLGYGAFVNRMGSNYQIQIGVSFPYDQCPPLRSDDALDLLASAWLVDKI